MIPKFITSIRDGKPPVIFGDGEQTRDFTFVANVVQANLGACRAGEEALGGAYNIGCGERISLNDLVKSLGRLTGKQIRAEHVDPRAGDVRHSLASIDLAGSRLGFRPEVDLIEGLKRTLEAY